MMESDFQHGPKAYVLALGLILTAEIGVASQAETRYVKQNKYPGSSEIVVVAEGEFEPRSVGSYTLRIYSGANPKFALDDYVTGLVRPRNGSVEEVKFHDFDGDGRAEIMVVIRSVGTGGYLSADLFAYTADTLKLLGSVSDLSKGADLVSALKKKLGGE